jgi:hypothetical protein
MPPKEMVRTPHLTETPQISIPYVVQNDLVVSQLAKSPDKADRLLYSHLLKMSTCLLVLGNLEPYLAGIVKR